ncbi:MAG: universal stress protein [Nitrospirae bacterium]|nr:universal stress protein [Nitrospirota bacterium]MCL5976844.1 universal stress protein [Nitrospirota bacterium]
MSDTTICPIKEHGKILVATDGSDFSKAAVCQAINLAKICSSKIYAISVVEVNQEFESLAPNVVEKMEKETKEHLDGVKAQISKEGIECETIVHQGEEPYEFIVSEAEKNNVDIIVMGSHGRTGLKRLLMGSVTSRVIGHAPCSVLVVKEKK